MLVGLAPSVRAQDAGGSGENFLERIFHKDVKVIAVTDFTDAGRKLTLPSKDHPVYFEALIKGYNDWGRSIAGEKIPDKKSMVKLLFKVLADQGYLPATREHKPTLLLAFAWGSMNDNFGTSLLFMGGDKLDLMWETNPYVGGLLDPRVLTRNMRSGDADVIMQTAGGNIYIASVQAFDEAAAMNGDAVLLWHTKISCPADGLEMDATLKQMVRTAAPYFGHETLKPTVQTAPVKKGEVDIGEIKVLESMDVSKLPVTDTTDDEGRPRPTK